MQAVLDDADFNKGLSNYLSGVSKAEKETGSMASGITSKLSALGSGFMQIGEAALKAGFAAAAAGATALAAGLGLSVKAAMEAQDVEVQLDAILKSTGKSATNSKQSIMDYAASMSMLTQFDDEAIVSAQALLLTFDNMSGAVIPRATTAAMNLATTFKIDLQAATRLVGRALSDTSDGVTELARMGVKFSKDEQEMIKALTATSGAAAAQDYVLSILENRLGGTAEAAGTTLSGKMAQLKTQLGNVAETVGMALIPALTSFSTTVMATLGSPEVQAAIALIATALGQLASGNITGALSSIAGALSYAFGVERGVQILAFLETVQGAAQQAFGFFQTNVLPVLQQIGAEIQTFVTQHAEGLKGALIAIGAVIAASAIVSGVVAVGVAIAALANPITLIIGAAALLGMAWTENWGGIQEKTQAVISFITSLIQSGLAMIQQFWAENGAAIMGFVQSAWSTIQEIISWASMQVQAIVGALSGFITEHWATIQQVTDSAWTLISTLVENAIRMIQAAIHLVMSIIRGDWEGAWESIKTILSLAWENIKTLVREGLDILGGIIRLGWDLISGAFKVAVTETWTVIKGIFNTALADVREKIGSFSLYDVGRQLLEGLARGITSAAGFVIDAARNAIAGAIQAAKNALGISSPSKVFMEIGVRSGEGFGIGLANALQPAGQMLAGMVAGAMSGGVMQSAPAMSTSYSTTTNYYLAANYTTHQSEMSLRDTVRLLQAGL